MAQKSLSSQETETDVRGPGEFLENSGVEEVLGRWTFVEKRHDDLNRIVDDFSDVSAIKFAISLYLEIFTLVRLFVSLYLKFPSKSSTILIIYEFLTSSLTVNQL